MGSSADTLSQPKHYNRHHTYPKSRIPTKYHGGKNKVLGKWMVLQGVPIKAHNALHAIFGNRVPEEQIVFLKKLCDQNGILNLEIYAAYKDAFDALFSGNISFVSMLEVTKQWDLSKEARERYADRLAMLYKVLNFDISGGIPLRKFKLN
ncbi:MAG: hypothetical protein HYW79_00095 [Parcubacteria group bacterium]|nr:hypothetical protein [Parcubacteria group bacterium]